MNTNTNTNTNTAPMANAKAMPAKAWRNTRRGGRPVVVSPEGRVYFGTAQECRTAVLSPWIRRVLAEDLMLCKRVKSRGVSAEICRFEIGQAYREALTRNAAERLRGCNCVTRLTTRDKIEIEAAARSLGKSHDEFVRDAITAAIEATRNAACGELQYTRQEMAALSAVAYGRNA